MDYSGYSEFPFPSKLDEREKALKDFFLSLDDEEQLKLLTGSKSYPMFCDRLKEHSKYKHA